MQHIVQFPQGINRQNIGPIGMPQAIINTGDVPADGSGDPIRVSFNKTNANFTELYTKVNAITANISLLANPVLSVAGKSGTVLLSTDDIIGGVHKQYVDNRFSYLLREYVSNIINLSDDTVSALSDIDSMVTNLTETISNKANISSVYTKADIDIMMLNIGNTDDWGFVTDPVTVTDDYGSI